MKRLPDFDSIKSLALAVGAREEDMVSFDRYAEAAQQLTRPSSLARALFGGAQKVERADLLMLLITQMNGESNHSLEKVVRTIDVKLLSNQNRQ